MPEEQHYDTYAYDTMQPGRKLELERSVYCSKYDLSDLMEKSLEELQTMIADSTDGENKAFEIVKAAADQWEKQAAVTQRLYRAMDYVRMSPVRHTGNQWIEGEDGTRTISNMVYKMTCRLSENTQWNLWKKNSLPPRWCVEWGLYINSPRANYSFKIAGQRKAYAEKADAEKYLNGRISTYSKNFSELSPPIPQKYIECFIVSERLLPGYRADSEGPKQEKPSVMVQLSAAKAQENSAPSTGAATKKKEDMQL